MIAYAYNGIPALAVILESKEPVNRGYIIRSLHIKEELQGLIEWQNVLQVLTGKTEGLMKRRRREGIHFTRSYDGTDVIFPRFVSP